MGPTHFYGATAEKKPKKADFAMKQTNICRLSGDIMTIKRLMARFRRETKKKKNRFELCP